MKTLILMIFFIFNCLGCKTIETLPAEYEGVWKTDCTNKYDLLGIKITESQVIFWETVGNIKQIELLNNAVYKVDLTLSSEGEQWESSIKYQVNGLSLIQLPSENIDGIIRYKCENISYSDIK